MVLSEAGVWCLIGSTFLDAVAFAGDIILIAPAVADMRKLLTVCHKFARDYCIPFHDRKTKSIWLWRLVNDAFSACVDPCTFLIYGKPIEFVNLFSYVVIWQHLHNLTKILTSAAATPWAAKSIMSYAIAANWVLLCVITCLILLDPILYKCLPLRVIPSQCHLHGGRVCGRCGIFRCNLSVSVVRLLPSVWRTLPAFSYIRAYVFAHDTNRIRLVAPHARCFMC